MDGWMDDISLFEMPAAWVEIFKGISLLLVNYSAPSIGAGLFALGS